MFAVLLVITGFSEILTTAGFSSYLIQKTTIDEKTYSTIFVACLIQGAIIAITLIIFAVPISHFFDLPSLSQFLRLSAVIFIFLPFRIVPFAQLSRVSAFKKISLFNLTANGLSILTAVLLLWYEWKIEALLAKIIVQLTVSSALFFFLSSARFPRYFDYGILKKASSFTVNQTLADSIGYWSRKIDDFSIAKLIGATGLGLYAFAYNFLMLPNLLIKNQFVQLIFPLWASLKEDEEQIRFTYIKLSSVLAFMAFPLLFLIFSICEEAVLVLIGQNWLASVPIIKLFCISALFEITIIPGTLFKALSRADLNLQSVGITKLITLVGIVIASFQGSIIHVAQSIVLTNFINFFIFGYFVKRIAHISVMEVLKANFLELVVSIPILLVSLGIEQFSVSLLNSIFLKTLLGVLAWLSFCILLKPFPYRYIRNRMKYNNATNNEE